jgi:hypothetical protein
MAPASYGILGFGDGREDPPRVFRQKKTIKAICHELRASRKLVRKVSRSEATEFRYEQPLPRIGSWQDALGAQTPKCPLCRLDRILN